MLTIDQIRNPRRKSGFDHVNIMDGPTRKPRFRGQIYLPADQRDKAISAANHAWYGPSRVTAEEAAKDVCDYVNGGGVAPAPRLKSINTPDKREPLPRDPELEAALGVLRDRRGARKGKPCWVYLMGVEGNLTAVKIGSSTNPQARRNEHQCSNHEPLVIVATIPGTRDDEKALQQKYIDRNIHNEWFRLSPEILAEFGLSMLDYIKGVMPATERTAA